MTLNGVTVNGNRSGNNGGGIFFTNYSTAGSLNLTNATIYSNTAQTSGGGLYVNYGGSGAVPGVAMTDTTIAHNKAVTSAGGSIYNNQSTVSLAGSIVAYGTAGSGGSNCDGNPSANITSQGYNLASDASCGLSVTGDIKNTDPTLGPLQDNGGDTETAALLYGSPAIDQIPPGVIGCGTTVVTDQRGVPRPRGAGCDIGAFETEYPRLELAKRVDGTPVPGGRITYAITITNSGVLTATEGVVSDTLASSLIFAGPVKLEPPGTGTPGTEPPILVSSLTITPEGRITVTFPVTIATTGVVSGTVITNTAWVTSSEVTLPIADTIILVVPGTGIHLPVVLRQSP
jgi:uncharacterized repeat protein (TIGR01451 family)